MDCAGGALPRILGARTRRDGGRVMSDSARAPRDADRLDIAVDTQCEWLEADGLGGFASSTTSGVRTRRYHALLLAAARPPSDRFVLVNGFVACVETAAGREELVAQHYAPGVTTSAAEIVEFCAEPWPSVRYLTPSGVELVQEILVERGSP